MQQEAWGQGQAKFNKVYAFRYICLRIALTCSFLNTKAQLARFLASLVCLDNETNHSDAAALPNAPTHLLM